MTISPIPGNGGTVPPMRVSLLTAPVTTGILPIAGDDALRRPDGTPPSAAGATVRNDAPISLAGRLDSGDALPETTQLALALESATRALQSGRPEQVLTELDAIWSHQLLADSPWYLRTAALQLLGRMTDAEQVMRDAIERLPRSAALLYLLGVYTSNRGHPDAARLANDHALALHPTEPLLWLQRAALASQSGMHDTAAAILARVQLMEPAFPAAQWLTTLVRLGGAATRSATPGVQRAIERLTPSSVALVSDKPAPVSASTVSVLETAIRYGLTLLESPTQSARSTTHNHGAADPAILYAQMPSRSESQPPTRVTPPTWDAWILVSGLLVLAFVPPLRLPALMLCGAMTMLIISSRMR
jgi:tetratricopeptide (TPR) repeat protein